MCARPPIRLCDLFFLPVHQDFLQLVRYITHVSVRPSVHLIHVSSVHPFMPAQPDRRVFKAELDCCFAASTSDAWR